MRRHFSYLIICVSLVGLIIGSAPAQWDQKPLENWSDKDVKKLLNDSPWARTQEYSNASELFRPFPNQQPVNAPTTGPPNARHIAFRVRFLSAKPVRLAVKRQLELKSKDKMTPELAEGLKQFVSREFPDHIVITVVVESDQRGGNFQAALALLNTLGTGLLKNDTFLEIKGGQRLFLQDYVQPKEDGLGARFIFTRNVDGKPFITPESNEVRFYSELSPEYKLDRRFKLKDMVYEGKLEY